MAVLTPARWTLRARLLAVLMALLLTVCTVVGVVTVLALQSSLTNRVDEQLIAAADRTATALRPPADHRQRAPRPDLADRPELPEELGFLAAPGTAADTLGARLVDGQVSAAAVLDKTGTAQPVASSARPVLTQLPVDGHPHSRDITGLGTYRLIAADLPGGDVVITGLPLAPVRATVTQVALVVGGVAAAGLLAAFLAGAAIVRRTLRPLNRVAATATRVAELPLHSGEVALAVRVPEVDTDPRTEVGQVGSALNQMLGHIASALAARHASETRVRQFVADASHELRTPLAAIRGYAELTRRGQQVVPEDVAYAIGRVESESARMTTLVDDLLLLARLDAGRPLARDRVDLSRLLVDALNDARAAGPEHRWELHLPEEPVVVTGDPHRLHQVLANLLTNARTHTPTRTRVTVELTPPSRTGVVLLRVIDEGPGIPASLQPTVFERFARGDTSRSRAAGSTGLGLAIVAAVTEAHGGRVRVDSTPGRTAFTIELPNRTPRHDSRARPASPEAPETPDARPPHTTLAHRRPVGAPFRLRNRTGHAQ
ncbi:HAMP domain-containing sensor histidine kinase [Actinopolymorpha pittospori]|uniref:histidine kinase n=1 Tax=Actinopolymorpha pittospori TaxID=648752 RepID=A0A927N3S5_9ACTN|nr:HAMP domain-containing sensor histidine kinase [Actinopolymorpha pittospori]MBE1608050.1 two-component system OmpR family sensor kinase [Actinopolymorpha pittospori]